MSHAPAQREQFTSAAAVTTYGWVAIVRIASGILVMLALVGITAITLSRADSRTGEPALSAVQVIQVYAEGLFYAVVAIGLGIAAYIASRSND